MASSPSTRCSPQILTKQALSLKRILPLNMEGRRVTICREQQLINLFSVEGASMKASLPSTWSSKLRTNWSTLALLSGRAWRHQCPQPIGESRRSRIRSRQSMRKDHRQLSLRVDKASIRECNPARVTKSLKRILLGSSCLLRTQSLLINQQEK